MSLSIAKFQIGKNGLTEGTIEALSLVFKTHKQVRISVLKSSGRDKSNIEDMAKKLSIELGLLTKTKYTVRIIGFTIILSKY